MSENKSENKSELKFELDDVKQAVAARIRINDDQWLGKILTKAEIRDRRATLYCNDGHILIVPASDIIIEVLPWENVKEDGSNIKSTIFEEKDFDMVVITKNAEANAEEIGKRDY